MNKLTIQINNLEALERLIGGDTEVEIEIRNSVVQNFADKHLKDLANTPEISGTLSQIKEEIYKQARNKIENEIATFKTSYGSSITDVQLRPAIQEKITTQIKNLVEDTVRQSVNEAIKVWATNPDLKRRIDARFEYYTKEYINSEIKERLEKVKASL